MQYLDLFHFSLTSLLVLNLLPFLFYGFRAKYWYDFSKLKRWDFILGTLCVILSACIVLKLIRVKDDLDVTLFKFGILHLMPLAFTLLAIKNSSQYIPRKYQNEFAGSGNAPTDTETSYQPRPLTHEISKLSWQDLIIDDNLKSELVAVIELLKDPKTSQKYGIEAPKGILLEGPPGTGKTTIAKVVANAAGLSFFNLGMDEIVSKWVGESEKNLSKLFNAARKHAPAVIFIDEVDAIGRGRSTGGASYSENLLNHLLQLMDGVVETHGLYIIAATNRADLVDEALKRPGRLNRVINVPLPHMEARYQLFKLYFSRLKLAQEIDFNYLANETEGLSGADISAICNQSGLNAFKRESAISGKKKQYSVTVEDIQKAFQDFAKA